METRKMKSWSSRAILDQSRCSESLPRVAFPEGLSNKRYTARSAEIGISMGTEHWDLTRSEKKGQDMA